MKYLITCAGSKIVPTTRNESSLNHLSHSDLLHDARVELLNLTGIQLDWNYTLPAWKLYSGTYSRLYPKVSTENWQKKCVQIKILSALFGWINHNDLVPFYDTQMKDLIVQNNQRIYKYWHNHQLLQNIVEQNDIDLLSGDYRKAVHGNINPIAVIPNQQFTDYGVQKGIWLNGQLNDIVCN